MAYNSYASTAFDSFQPLLTYTFNLYKKDYTGGVVKNLLLSGNPVIHEWQDDDPKAPIKGSTLKISIITNSDSNLELQEFYSEDDYGFYCELTRNETGEFLFRGYLLQDESQELQVDFSHEIQLTFTDGLGLLKGVTLNEAAVIVGQDQTETGLLIYDLSSLGTPPRFYVNDSRIAVLQPGDQFSITYSSVTYYFNCLNVTYDPLFTWIVWVDRPITFPSGGILADFTYRIPYSLTGYISLLDIYKLCLKSTYIDTGINCYTRLYPAGGTNERLLDDTFIQAETFLKDGSWMDCYSVLEQINSRFNLMLCQAHGQWNIIRFDEVYRYTITNGVILQKLIYNNDFVYVTSLNENLIWIFKGGNDMEVGVLKSVNRANQFVKETFNYVQPESLLCNYDLKKLGNLITEYTSGVYNLKEYELPDWYDGPYAPYPKRFIRITYDNDPTSKTYLQELDRNIVIVNGTGSAPESAKSCDISFTEGDSFEFNMSFRTSVSQAGPVTTIIAISLTDGINTYFLQTDGSWGATLGYSYTVPAGDDTINWHTITIQANPTPISGILNIYLPEATPNGSSSSTDETLIKDLSFVINYFINGSGKIIGHTHKDSQSLQIKNNIDKEIYLDNAPNVTINGALFLESYTNLVRDLTVGWTYPGSSNSINLGIITTTEALFTTYKMRSVYEGKLLYINKDEEMLNPLSIFWDLQRTIYSRFVVGKLTINYKTGFADINLVEIVDNPSGIFSSQILQFLQFAEGKLYEFNYLYEKY